MDSRDSSFDQVVTILLFCRSTISDPANARLVPVQRVVPSDREPLDATMQQLFLGVTAAEAAEGLSSVGGPYVASTYLNTTLEGGIATLHLRSSIEWTNNITTANYSGIFYRLVEANVFQFPNIHGLEINLGDPDGRWCGFENSCSDDSPYPYFTDALVPGQPCALGSHRDCIDLDGDVGPTYLIGGGDCMEAFAPDSTYLCSDLDGDGHAGYPDAGEGA